MRNERKASSLGLLGAFILRTSLFSGFLHSKFEHNRTTIESQKPGNLAQKVHSVLEDPRDIDEVVTHLLHVEPAGLCRYSIEATPPDSPANNHR